MNIQRRYRNMDDLIGNIFNEAFDIFGNWPTESIRFNKSLSTAPFPPTNISIDQVTKVMTIQAALAGVKEEWINLSFDGDSLKLTVQVPQELKEGDKVERPYYLQQGLKTFSNIETSWVVDTRYFDREKVSVQFNDGLLVIDIPPRDEVAPKKIPIFGKLQLEKKED